MKNGETQRQGRSHLGYSLIGGVMPQLLLMLHAPHDQSITRSMIPSSTVVLPVQVKRHFQSSCQDEPHCMWTSHCGSSSKVTSSHCNSYSTTFNFLLSILTYTNEQCWLVASIAFKSHVTEHANIFDHIIQDHLLVNLLTPNQQRLSLELWGDGLPHSERS